MIPRTIKLFSWVDIEEVLLRSTDWPQCLYGAQVYWETLELTIEFGAKGAVVAWLAELFAPRFHEEHGIIMEGLEGQSRYCTLSFDETEQAQTKQSFMPSLRRPKNLRNYPSLHVDPPQPDKADPAIVAFHSFKGGVGRTLHALALARAMEKSGAKVLLVDGDFEAPGFSWLLTERLPELPVSYADLLAVAQGDASPHFQDTLKLVAHKLQSARLGNITILPAFRSRSRWNTLEIRPEHLNSRQDPFRLYTLLAELGKLLSVDTLIVDTRAGLSELSAGLILDPNIYRIFVSSSSGQSRVGTSELLQIVGEQAPPHKKYHPSPVGIISLVAKEIIDFPEKTGEQEMEVALQGLTNAQDDQGYMIITSSFEERLLSLPLDWNKVMALLDASELIKGLAPLVDTLAPGAARSVSDSGDLENKRKQLMDKAELFEYAEAGVNPDRFLKTDALTRLASDHRFKLPNVLVLGAKGAGKTYSFLQLARLTHWSAFIKTIFEGDSEAIQESRLIPLLHPQNVSEPNLKILAQSDKQEQCLPAEIKDRVRGALPQDWHEGQWRDFWLDLFAWRCGFEQGKAGAGSRFPKHLASKNEAVVFLIDGLEDLFQEIGTDPKQQKALRGLLQEVPLWLKQHPAQTVGVIIFVRRDLVASAVTQNLGQLEHLHKPYQLVWGETEALRLVAWICTQAGVYTDTQPVEDWSQDKLKKELAYLWGNKLGAQKSKEASSQNWVLDVLSDLKQQVQARDLVRFLRVSADKSLANKAGQWLDRVLIPAAIRASIDTCSEKKITEVKDENSVLKTIFGKIEKQTNDKKTLPFKAKDMDLTEEDIQALERHGVVLVENQNVHMPEIYRQGLGFKLSRPGRVQVRKLKRMARRKEG